MKLMSWLTAAGLGATLMYFYDPQRGNRRRALVRDQVYSMRNDAEDFLQEAVEDLRNRAGGLSAEVRSMTQRTAEGMPERTRSRNSELTPGVRLLMGAGGGMLALYGRARKGLIGSGLTAAGLGIAARGLGNMELSRMIGRDRSQGAIQVTKSLNIAAPIEEVYRFWTNYSNFPQFMEHVKEVTMLEDSLSHWKVAGPGGTEVEWDAITTDTQENRLIAWESVEGSQVKTAGRVQFHENPSGGTRITVHMNYTPPAGVLGHAVATLLGENPRQQMNEDLGRLKGLFEEGKTTVKGRLVTRDEAQAGANPAQG